MAPAFLTNMLPKRDQSNVQGRMTFFQAVGTLTWMQWALFFSGWLAWTCDAMDFFSVSLSVKALGTQFNKQATDITTSITLTLLFRSFGALVFGLISDRYGRKWPLVINLLICCVFELGTGFANTFSQFLALRSFFGIAMGGIWGMASSTALETLPVEVRGFASGVIQEGYAVGYLFAAVVNLKLVPEQSHGWRALFWTAAGLSALAAFVRACLPESPIFLRARAAVKASGEASTGKKTRVFIHETLEMLRIHWKLWIYAVLLMSGFNFLSHGSQDLYPTYLEATKGFSDHNATIATIIGNCGAIVGGALAGAASQYVGRRVAICACIILVGAFIPLWIVPSTFSSLAAGAFCLQIGVQGAWGVIPIYLAEISPPAFRALFPGLSYQLGNMVSSASAQIEATGAAQQRTIVNGKDAPDYAKVQGIFIGVICAFTLFMVVIGPEHHGSHFEKHKTAFEKGGGLDDAYEEEVATPESSSLNEKQQAREAQHVENPV